MKMPKENKFEQENQTESGKKAESEKKTESGKSTQKLEKGQNGKTVGVTAFLTKIFQSTRSNAFPLFREDGDIGDDGVDVTDSQSERRLNLKDVHDEYEFRKQIAVGGQGTIREAYDKNFRRIVAIKTLNEEFLGNEKAREAFINEAVLTAKLEHPAIVPIHGIYGDNEKGLHLAMKLVKGRTLKNYLNVLRSQYKIMSKREIKKNEDSLLSQKFEFFLRVCGAVAFLHKRNVVHRDLKPENVMIGDFNETYIMDLGIAIHRREGGKDLPAGTPQYIAPEVISGEPYDHRSDIFLLGLLLYELFCLSPAYSPKPMEEAIAQARLGQINPIRHEFGINIFDEIKYIIKKAVMRNPDDRYQTVEELSNDIRALISMEPTKANPHKFRSFLRCFLIKRYPILLGLTLTALLLFFAALGYTYQRSAAEAERQQYITQITSKIISNGVLRVSALNDKIRKFENLLSRLAEEASVRLEIPPEPSAAEETVFTTRISPPEYTFSPAYGSKINLDYYVTVIPQNATDADRDKIENERLKLVPIRKAFFRAICDSRRETGYGSEQEVKYKILFQKQPPINRIYIGLLSGLFVSYPYTSGYKDDYDPKTRPWFKDAINVEGKDIAWSKPYQDAASKEVIITCARKLLSNQTGAFLGVAGADIALSELAEIIEEDTTYGPALTGTYLLDEDGAIILDTSSWEEEVGLLRKKFTNKNAFRAMMLSTCGHFYSVEDGKKVFYFFMKIPSLKWIYVEKFDYNKLINEQSW